MNRIKLVVLTFCTVVFLLAAVAGVHARQVLVDVDFNEGDEDGIFAKLGIPIPEAFELVPGVGPYGERVLAISEPNIANPPDRVHFTVPFPEYEGEELWIDTILKVGGGGQLVLYGTYTGNRHACSVIYRDASFMAQHANADGTGTIGTWVKDGDRQIFMPYTRWYRITLRFDLPNRTYSLYIDGELFMEDLPFRPEGLNKLDAVQILYLHDKLTAYISRITVTTYNPFE